MDQTEGTKEFRDDTETTDRKPVIVVVLPVELDYIEMTLTVE